MSVDKNESAGIQAAHVAQRTAPEYRGTTQSAAAPEQRQVLGLSDVAALRRSTFSHGNAGETVENFKRAFEKLIEPMGEEVKKSFVFEVLSREQDRVHNSALLITRPIKMGSEAYIVVVALPIEASNPINETRAFQNMGQTTEISWAVSDVLDGRFSTAMNRALQSRYGTSVKVIFAAGRPLPSELKSDDEQHLLRILRDAEQAIITASETHITNTPGPIISARTFLADNARASVQVSPVPVDADDSVGNPVRAGIVVELRSSRSQPQNLQNQSLNDRENDKTLTRTMAYVEPIYDTRHLSVAPVYPGAPRDTRCMLPRIVIRSVDSALGLLTPELQMLGMASTTALSQNIGLWANSLRPRNFMGQSADIQRMTDVGGLGLVAPLNPKDPEDLARISTDPREFSDRDFESLIERTFMHDDKVGPIYTLLVEEMGERSWLTDVYQYAADGDIDAHRALINTANNATDGHFDRVWSMVPEHERRIVHDDKNRVHMGYFVDSAKVKHDLNCIDTLAIINIFGDKDKELVWSWMQSFNPNSGTMEQRLATREQILRNAFTGVTIKGFGRHVTLYQTFIDSFNSALRHAGLLISPANTRAGEFQTRPQFGMFDPAQFSVGFSRTGGVFSSGQMNMGGNYRGIGPMSSTFGANRL